MSKITINGKCFTVEGALSMINGKWYDGYGREIDMNNLEGLEEAKTINITIEGNVDKLSIDCCNTITVNGNCKKINTGSGDINCLDIDGDATTGSGNIECNAIEGDAKTGSGNIRCSHIGGMADTGSGSINGKRRSYGGPSVFINGESLSGSAVKINGTAFSQTFGDVISGGFTMTKTPDGKKHMTLHKDCTVNGRRIGDMTDYELQEWIDAMAKKGKIITII